MRLALPIVLLSATSCASEDLGPRLLAGKNNQISGQTKEFNAIVSLLNKTFKKGCQTMADMDSITVMCTKPGMTATLTTDGASDPIVPHTLQVCQTGTPSGSVCNSINYYQVNHDIKFTKLMLEGPRSRATGEWTAIKNLVINNYSDCNTSHDAYRTKVYCVQGGGSATLYGSGGPNPIPQSLQVCMDGLQSGSSCQTVNFIQEKNSIRAAKKLIKGGGKRRRHLEDRQLSNLYNRIEQTLYSRFGEDGCHVLATMNSVSLSCSRPGQSALLQAVGVTDPSPQSLQVCMTGVQGGPHCSVIDFNNVAHAEQYTKLLLTSDPQAQANYQALIQLLNQYFKNSCTTQDNASSNIVSCTKPGESVTLTSSGGSIQLPLNLQKCTVGVSEPYCETLYFNNINKSVKKAEAFLEM